MKNFIMTIPVVVFLFLSIGCSIDTSTNDTNRGTQGQTSSVSSFSSSSTASSVSSSASSSAGSPSTLTVIIDLPIVFKDIGVSTNFEVQADISITNPSGSFQTKTWYFTNTNVLTFVTSEAGYHDIGLIQYDSGGNVFTNGGSFDVHAGTDYTIHINISGIASIN